MTKRSIAIIGGGPAGLMAADVLAPFREVHLYEHGKSVGRKFLVAGQGGFNLTNSADRDVFASVYSPPHFMDEALAGLGPSELRAWFEEVGIDTFVGSSGRVFPKKGIKPIDVLNAMRERLLARGVRFHLEHAFDGFDARVRPIMESAEGRFPVEAEHILFALGGASWPVTGSTGIWPSLFAGIGIRTNPFRSSNCGLVIPWPEQFAQAHAGKPLKNIHIASDDRQAFGEASITAHGLEGNAIYPIVPAVRDALGKSGAAFVHIDLKPNNTADQLLRKLQGRTPKEFAEALNLGRPELALLKAFTTKERFLAAGPFAQDVKDLRLPVHALRPVDEAISTVGGIRTADLAPDLSFKEHPHLFAIGEMVDWDAPTGGFLLQGCFSMGHHAATSILARG